MQVKMYHVKTHICHSECWEWSCGMSLHLGMLTLHTGWVQCWTSIFIRGQTKWVEIKWYIAQIPGCARECNDWKTRHLCDTGTSGQAPPVEISQRRVMLESGSVMCDKMSNRPDYCSVGIPISTWSCWAVAIASKSIWGTITTITSTRDKASATTLSLPLTWETNSNCRICCGEYLSDWRARENVRGLWSVRMWKTRPSTKYQNCLIEK